MRRFTHYPPLILALLLGGCLAIRQQPPTAPIMESPSFLSEPSSEAPLEAGDIPTSTPADTPTLAGTGSALPERITEWGYIDIGHPNAPHVLEVFTNHACAYCGEFARDHLTRLEEDFLRKGLLLVRILPVSLQKYPNSRAEAAALLCATGQSKGLMMHRALFSLRSRTAQAMTTTAKDLGLDLDAFSTCLKSLETESLLVAQASVAKAANVTLVPRFTVHGETITGLPSYPDLRGKVEQEIQR